MSFLIDPPWLYANGRAYAALAPEQAQGRTAAAAGAATMAVFWGVSISLYLNRRGRAGSGGCAARATGATGCSTRASCGSTSRRPGRSRTRSARCCSPPIRSGSGAAGATAADAVTEARFPHVAPDKGHYESFYLRAVDPERPRGAWIRHTTLQRPGQAPDRLGLVHVLRRRARRPVRGQGDAAGARAADWIAIGDSTFGPAGARGHARRRAAPPPGSWRCGATRRRCATSRARWMYTAPLPRTKLESPLPSAIFDGTITAGDRAPVSVDGWPGMVGHNWGAEHAATLDLAARDRVRR